jgi:hypothetical protein
MGISTIKPSVEPDEVNKVGLEQEDSWFAGVCRGNRRG